MMPIKPPNFSKHAWIAVLSVVSVVLLITAASVTTVFAYSQKIYPRITIGGSIVSGLTKDEAKQRLHERVDTTLNDGLTITIQDKTETIPVRFLSPDDPDLSKELVLLQIDEAVDAAFAVGHTGSLVARSLDVARALYKPRRIPVEVTMDSDAIGREIVNRFEPMWDPAVEPAFEFTYNEETSRFEVDIIPGAPGHGFDLEETLSRIQMQFASLAPVRLTVDVRDQSPKLTTEDAQRITGDAQEALRMAPYKLAYDGGRWQSFSYELGADDLAQMLRPSYLENEGWAGAVIEGNETFDAFLESMANDIEIEAQNARFEIQGTRVEEFSPSREGRALDLALTRERLLDEIRTRGGACLHESEPPQWCNNPPAIDIAVTVTEPSITTREVNDLGIGEILGVGTSNFKGSPANRVKNIRHGVNKLNGILIKPDEEFSLLTALRPFTIEDGYLPELVIKGDEIKPEVGGGLCQIGSTTFRAAMNSGLLVTERRNHSLVVRYYNDPANGNPGTDATIYDPAPDFKFINDTGNYILFTTSMNDATGDLRFTLWGTNDGRKGYYSAPVVHKWLPQGEAETRYTADLAPGVRQCQGGHPGASASFVYTVERPGQEVKQTTYESYYRPLPVICLEGIEPEKLDENGKLKEESATESVPTETSGPPTESAEETSPFAIPSDAVTQ